MILKEVSSILGFQIHKDSLETDFTMLDKDGRLGKREILKILVLLVIKEAEREERE